MYRISREDNLESCLQQIDDPAERARVIEQAYKLRRPRNEKNLAKASR